MVVRFPLTREVAAFSLRRVENGLCFGGEWLGSKFRCFRYDSMLYITLAIPILRLLYRRLELRPQDQQAHIGCQSKRLVDSDRLSALLDRHRRESQRAAVFRRCWHHCCLRKIGITDIRWRFS